tara:strand:- start:146 stop:379 length:234 start_codon:yes stop_codon:yes gene_type:complete
MEIKLRYYGQLKEVTGKSEEVVNKHFSTIGQLNDYLIKCYPKLENHNYKIAQNNIIESFNNPLVGSLIDLLPPFSGG